MPDSVKDIFLGIFILFLAIIIWRMEHLFWAWALFFLGGSFYIIWGFIKGLK